MTVSRVSKYQVMQTVTMPDTTWCQSKCDVSRQTCETRGGGGDATAPSIPKVASA